MKPFKFLLFFLFLFTFFIPGKYDVYAQSCTPIGTRYENCSGNSTSIVDPSPYGHFSNSAVGTSGTLTVSCEQRVLNTSQREVIECLEGYSVYNGSCQTTVQNTGTDVSCNVLTTCGNTQRDVYECCDPSAGDSNCNASCQCVFSQSEQGGFCGDGICGSGEDISNCSRDCSGSSCSLDNTPNADTFGPSNVIVYQGETTAVTSIIRDSGPGPGSISVNYVFNGCPDGATCTGEVGFAYAEGDETDGASMIISTTGSTPVGNYPVIAHFYNPLNNSCSDTIRYNVIVRPSRRTVCDGGWYPVAGDFAAYQSPIGKYFSTSATMNVFAPNASTGRNINEQICRFATAGQTCIWDMGWTNTSNFSSVVNQAVNIPSAATSRTAIASTLSNGMFQLGNSGWQVYSGATPTWGNPTSTSDPFGRTYQFRRGSGNVVEYMCTATQPDLNVDTLSVIGTRNTGQSLGFRGTVRNTGNASTVDTSQSSLKIDIGNNGSWDVTVSPNQSTGVLAPSGSEIETWNSAWTATAGTHRFEICADETGEVTESNEGNNCSLAGTGVFTVNSLPVTVSINAAQNPVISGNSTNITWSTNNETSCDTMTCTSGSCAWTEDDNAGSPLRSTGALTASRTYSMTCYPGPVTGNLTVTVSPDEYSLNVIKSGKGTVTSSPAGINCDVSCNSQSAQFDTNTTVVLTAEAAPGRIFTGWAVQGGGSCPGKGTCSVLINAAKTVTANFAVDPNYREF